MRTLEHYEGKMKDNTRVALVEQSIGHISQTLIRIETRLDKMDSRFDKLDVKVDSNLKWILGVYFAGFGALFGMLAHIQHWF